MPDSKRYLRPEVTTRIRRLELKARRVVEGFLSGMHRSPYFGQSIEFLQHRQYTRGDEIRHIDWKVYARQDRLHIKQYEEETNLRLTLLVDRSASMAYGQVTLINSTMRPQLLLALVISHYVKKMRLGCLPSIRNSWNGSRKEQPATTSQDLIDVGFCRR